MVPDEILYNPYALMSVLRKNGFSVTGDYPDLTCWLDTSEKLLEGMIFRVDPPDDPQDLLGGAYLELPTWYQARFYRAIEPIVKWNPEVHKRYVECARSGARLKGEVRRHAKALADVYLVFREAAKHAGLRKSCISEIFGLNLEEQTRACVAFELDGIDTPRQPELEDYLKSATKPRTMQWVSDYLTKRGFC
jgi:hypothetical protein